MEQAEIGVLGGSGIYDIAELKDVQEVRVGTPFGAPSDAFIIGTIAGRRVAFLPRHGRGHRISPTEINYRANICAFKQLGVQWLIASSACGSLREELTPGTLVVIDQLFDRTRARNEQVTFFDRGIVAHVSIADPFCPTLSDVVFRAGQAVGARIVRGGTYINMEGPAFSTRAESNVYRSWGMDVIGMTNLFEARLAREAEIHFATVALVTDYDCWHNEHADVDVAMVIRIVHENADTYRRLVVKAVESMPAAPDDICSNALAGAIMTNPALIAPETKSRLAAIIGHRLT